MNLAVMMVYLAGSGTCFWIATDAYKAKMYAWTGLFVFLGVAPWILGAMS